MLVEQVQRNRQLVSSKPVRTFPTRVCYVQFAGVLLVVLVAYLLDETVDAFSKHGIARRVSRSEIDGETGQGDRQLSVEGLNCGYFIDSVPIRFRSVSDSTEIHFRFISDSNTDFVFN